MLLHERLTTVLNAQYPETYEVVYVDDACPEGSAEVLLQLAGCDRRVGVIRLDRNLGRDGAIMIGLAHTRGRRVVVMDADLQDPPEAIPQLLAAFDGDVAAVFSGRRGAYEPTVRLVTSRIFRWTLAMLARRRIPVDAGPPLALDRALVRRLLEMPVRRPYLISLIARTGTHSASIPVTRAPSPTGRSSYTLGKRIALAWRAFAVLLMPPRRRGSMEPPPIAARCGAIFEQGERRNEP